ncbi:integrase/recombinase XerC [Selenomonas ruminantium]|uniref:Integrase/recombinase XerC n=1 Tax=Selenomonas ruminantium TaxID=971 RepID=A0A1M6WAM4_SELRU|nr:tyrosine-type recombinase/integrase [Selenomonas ruminantium]SHK90679.1 integrase/recombinase XerC [Selenomonas ruminantium]
MADNSIATLQDESSLALSLDTSAITPEYYVAHYMEFIPMYIGRGRPSMDTLNTYKASIDMFINWCVERNYPPLAAHEHQMRIYFHTLVSRGLQQNTIATRLTGVRIFFRVAKKLNFIKVNPCADISLGVAQTMDEHFRYYSPEQVQAVINAFAAEEDKFIRYRNTLIVMLMGVEGMRNVEVTRMNDEDVRWDSMSIYVHGKGHDGIIYPCEETFNILEAYLDARPPVIPEHGFTPTIVNDYNHGNTRISRNGVRFVMNRALESCNLKVKGYSCHVFRHSCGTNLYQKTKDLRVVQETLRHNDPKVTARYAHVQERMSKRYTSKLAPKIKV